jgi:DNA (cytosine-5)-methyltransferase 1
MSTAGVEGVAAPAVTDREAAERPRLLDLFCCAGGAARGYQRAGFHVTGVDIAPQPRYAGDEFHQADAIEYVVAHWREFDAIHASPPCQHYSPLNALSPEKVYPDLIVPTRSVLDASGRPYVIENVMTAPLIKDDSVVLCGGMFGLRTYRHRRFESPWLLSAPEHPKHVIRTATKRRRELWAQGWHVSITGDVGTYVGTEAMGIDWMTGNELCEAIPPAYTEYIGWQLRDVIEMEWVA